MKVHVLHENPDWYAPLGAAFDAAGLPHEQWLLADGVVMLKYTSENRGRRSNRTSLWRRAAAGRWQIFHHQGTLAAG